MIEKVYKFIKKFNMLDSCAHIYAGVSGGADSVCLLIVLNRIINMYNLDIQLTAIHVNHGIRMNEADRDEEFTKLLCERMNIGFISRHVNVLEFAEKNKLSEEEAGRILRYRIFNEYANADKNSKIAVAHHCNDQAETVLHNIIRGSSISGIGGIAPVRDNIIRPLLCVTREQIEEYLKKNNQDFVTDSTNLNNEYTRNKIRNVVIPYIKDNINERVIERLSDLSESAREADSYIKRQADRLYKECVTFENTKDNPVAHIDIRKIESADTFLVSCVIRMVLEKLAGGLKDIYKKHIMEIMSLMSVQSGKGVDIAKKIRAERVFNDLVIFKKEESSKENNCISDVKNNIVYVTKNQIEQMNYGDSMNFEVNEKIYLKDYGMVYVSKISFTKIKADELGNKVNNNISNQGKANCQNNHYTKYFNYDKIKNNLVVRFRREGDYIVINKNGNRKKLKKELIDCKIPHQYRDYIMLISDENNVIWAPQVRFSCDYKAEESSKTIIKASVEVREGNINYAT